MLTVDQRARCSASHKALVALDLSDRRALAKAVEAFFCNSKDGKIKLLKNRKLSVKNTKMWKERVTNAADIEAESQRKAEIALRLKTMRCHEEMLAVHERIAYSTARRAVGKSGNEPIPVLCVTGLGTHKLVVVRRDPSCGLLNQRLSKYTAPPGMLWAASDGSIAVALTDGKIMVCLLPWKGPPAVPAAASTKLGIDILPAIASVAVKNGWIFYSYYGAICRSPFGPRYEGATSLSRTVMELPGTSTIVMMHDGHTAFCVNDQFGVVWSQAQLPGVRRVSVVSWNPETPITGEEFKGRANGRYSRSPKNVSGPFKVYDSLPMGLMAGTPIPAAACGDTMVACQLGSVVHLVHVPFIGIGPVPAEWIVEKWGCVEGKLLDAIVTPNDTVRIVTTFGVYDSDDSYVKMNECKTAAWFGHEKVVRDDAIIGVALPDGPISERRKRVRTLTEESSRHSPE